LAFRNALNAFLFRGKYSLWAQMGLALLIMLLLFIVPLVWLFVVSLWEYNSSGVLAATRPVLENYGKFFTPFYSAVAFRTVRLGLLTTTIALLLGYPLAYILSRSRIRYKNIIIFILLTPLFVSVTVRVFGWEIILEHSGLINYLLTSAGLIAEPIKFLRTPVAVVIGLVNSQLTFMVMPIFSALESIKPSQEEAAQTLGANPVITWFRITLPLSIPGVLAGWTLVFMMSIASYVQPAVLGGANYFVMSTVLRSQIHGTLNWPFAAACGFVLLAIGLIAIYIPTWLVRKTIGANLERGEE